MDKVKRTIRIDASLAEDFRQIAARQKISENQLIVEALKTYRDLEYMETKATVINEDIYAALQGLVEVLETRINNKTNQVLSAAAIELGVLTQVIAHSLEVDPIALDIYRKNSASYLKVNQRVLKLKDVAE